MLVWKGQNKGKMRRIWKDVLTGRGGRVEAVVWLGLYIWVFRNGIEGRWTF